MTIIQSECESKFIDLLIVYRDYCQKIQLTGMIHKQR